MQSELLSEIQELNPWLLSPSSPILPLIDKFIPRLQTQKLLQKSWDDLCLTLIGPRQAGKTTLAKYISQTLIEQERFTHFLYLNCDLHLIRQWVAHLSFIKEATEQFNLHHPIIFLDEVQRLENPGLLLKSIVDLKQPLKLIASGSSQLEIKSQVQEYLTGRQLEAVILPLSYSELSSKAISEDLLIYGCYPQIVNTSEKSILLKSLFQTYIDKDIIEIFKIGKPDIMQQLIGLIAHSSGQLVNYQSLANDCRVSIPTIQNYLSILERTYVIAKIKPFVGNKRQEIISNPIYYFIDNGFRNQALNNFLSLERRTDKGLLIQSAVFQEIYKFKEQYFSPFHIHYWRSKGGAEVDFILYKNSDSFLPIEAKFRHLTKPTISRGFYSFIEAYQPKQGIIITKQFTAKRKVGKCTVLFIPFHDLNRIFPLIMNFFEIGEIKTKNWIATAVTPPRDDERK